MTIHSCAEGIGVGVAFSGGDRVGITTAVAIAVHNIPEGLAIALVLVPRGASILRATLLSIMSSLPQPLLAAPSFALLHHVPSLAPWGFGFAGGAMAWMVVAQLMPDAAQEVSWREAVLIAVGGTVAMLAFQLAIS
jgi:zinc transporter ZupT